MDEIQKVLIKEGRKDLAQKYYEKTAVDIAEKDAKAAKKIKNDLLKAYRSIADAVKKIDTTLSTFNAPGLKASFFDSLKSALSRSGFDRQKAAQGLSKYYEGR